MLRRQLLIKLPIGFGGLLGVLEKGPRPLRVALGEHLEPVLHHQEPFHGDPEALRIELERVLASSGPFGVVPVQDLMAGIDGGLLVLHGGGDPDAVRDAVAVGDDDGRSRIGFRLEETLEGMLVPGAHGHARDVDAPVGHGDEAEVFFGG